MRDDSQESRIKGSRGSRVEGHGSRVAVKVSVKQEATQEPSTHMRRMKTGSAEKRELVFEEMKNPPLHRHFAQRSTRVGLGWLGLRHLGLESYVQSRRICWTSPVRFWYSTRGYLLCEMKKRIHRSLNLVGFYGPVVLRVRFGSIFFFCQRVSPQAMWMVWGLIHIRFARWFYFLFFIFPVFPGFLSFLLNEFWI